MMGIVSRMARPKAMSPTDDSWYYPGDAFYGGSSPIMEGVDFDSDYAMRLLTVHNCVKILSQSIAQLPLHLMRRNGKNKEKATDVSLYSILHDLPNQWMTASDFWGMVVAHVSLRGNFYAYKIGLPGQKVLGLIPFKSDQVQKVTQNDDLSLIYHVSIKGGTKEIEGDKIFHVRGLMLDGLVGINPIEYARRSVYTGVASDVFLERFFSKGLHPGAVVKHPLSLSAPAHANLKSNLKAKYAGLGNSWDFLLIDEGMGIDFPEIKLVDAQFLEIGKFNMSQIAGMFRVPLMLLQANDAPTTYASAEQFMLAFVTHALTPLVVNIEKAIYRDLLTEKERKEYYAKFSMAGLLRGDIKTRFESYAIGIDKEILNPNEVRELEDLNPYSGGDRYATRTSTVKEVEK